MLILKATTQPGPGSTWSLQKPENFLVKCLFLGISRASDVWTVLRIIGPHSCFSMSAYPRNVYLAWGPSLVGMLRACLLDWGQYKSQSYILKLSSLCIHPEHRAFRFNSFPYLIRLSLYFLPPRWVLQSSGQKIACAASPSCWYPPDKMVKRPEREHDFMV